MICLFMEWITVIQSRFTRRLQRDLHLKELLSGSSIALTMRVTGMLLGYAFTLLITHHYGAVGMGIFALSLTILNIGTMMGKFGLDTTVMRLIAKYAAQSRWDEVLWTHRLIRRWGTAFATGISLLLWIITPLIARDVFHKPFLSPYFRWTSAAIFPLTLFYIFAESLRGLKRVKAYVFLQFILLSLFGGTILTILTLLGIDQPAAPLYAYLTAVTGGSGVAYLLWRHARQGIVPHSRQRYPEISSPHILQIASHMLISGSILLVMGWIDRIMLGIYTNEAQVGIYAVALRVAAISTIPMFGINSIAAPKFTELYNTGKHQELKRLVNQAARLNFWGSFPIIIICLLFPGIILSLFGAQFTGGIMVLLILCVGRFGGSACGLIAPLLRMLGKEQALNLILFGAAILNVILNLILIPRFGINGAAIASMVSLLLWNFTSVAYGRKVLGISSFYFPGSRSLR